MGLVDEAVPCVAASLDDGVLVIEDADREPVGSQVLPDVLDRVQFRAIGRERDEGDVVGNDQRVSAVPAGSVEHQHGLGAQRNGSGYLGKMGVHRGGVGEGHDEARRRAALRADRTKYVGPLVAGVARRPRPGSAFCPDAGERALLADARLVLEPDFQRLATRGLWDRGSYCVGKVFLKASCACGSVFGWRGRTERRR